MNINAQSIGLPELANRLTSAQSQKADYVLPARYLRMEAGQIVKKASLTDGLESPDGIHYDTTEVFEEHISDKLNIPNKYYRFLKGRHVDLLDYNITQLLEREHNKNFLFRTYQSDESSVARALLSDRYKTLDHEDVLYPVLEAIELAGVTASVLDCDITDKSIYVRFVFDNAIEMKEVGDTAVAGFILANSEVGFRSLTLQPRVVMLSCTNGMISDLTTAYKRRHAGAVLAADEKLINWSSETRRTELQLIRHQIGDIVKAYASKEELAAMIEPIRRLGASPLRKPADLVEKLTQTPLLSKDRKDQLLNQFIHSGNNTVFGLVQAHTHLAKELAPDQRFDAEVKSWELMNTIHSLNKN